MNNPIDIQWAEQYHTAQIYSNGAEVALSNSKGQQVGPFVWCKDFLHDALRARIHATPSSIYGYKTGAAELAMIDLDQPYVLLTNSDLPNLSKRLDNIQDFMQQADKAIVPWGGLTTYRPANNPPEKYAKCGVSYWTGSPLWMISPPAFSLWTLLLRNGQVHEIGRDWLETIQDIIKGKLAAGVANDGVYLEYAMPAIDLMRENGIDAVFAPKTKGAESATSSMPEDEVERPAWFQKTITKNYPPSNKLDIGTLHHFGGIVSFGDKSGKQAFKGIGWKWPNGTKKAPDYVHH